LLRAEEVFFLVTGAEKRAALADVLGPGSTLPAARIVQRPGPVVIFCDREASQDITSPR
jgi:6-phosphogluconolactonase/glucosamine-6-phosphate isomerase/deaminase